jgi:hypothetical protein
MTVSSWTASLSPSSDLVLLGSKLCPKSSPVSHGKILVIFPLDFADFFLVVSKLVSFNRSPTWVAPEFAWQMAAQGRGTKYSEEQRAEWRNSPETFRQYRRDIEHAMNSRFPSFYRYSEAQKMGRAMVGDMMRKRLQKKPELAKKLIPDFELGCRR